jgi:hypothetical protein
MKFKTVSINFFSVLEGTALATFCGLVYYAAFFLQTMISPWVNYIQGIDWFFIPAGIKLVAFMIAGVWGLIGIAVFGLITAFDVWHSDSLSIHIGNILIWAGVPYVTYRFLAKSLNLDLKLTNLKYWHVVAIALATTLTSSVGSSLYQYLINNRSFDMLTTTTFAMAIGDFIGTGVCVFALTFAVKNLDK